EQVGCGGVIEIFRRQPFRVLRQIVDHVAGECRGLFVEAMRFGQSGSMHIHDNLLNALSGADDPKENSSGVVGEAQSRELPAMMRIKEVTIGNTVVAVRGCK